MSKTKALGNLKKDANKEEKEAYDMCYAIDMLEKQSEERGIHLGIEHGIALAKNVYLLNSSGVSKDEIAQKLNISIDKVKSILDDTIEGSALSSHIE